MPEFVVRRNVHTHRILAACVCERTISLPDSGLSDHRCACGRVWACGGDRLEMYEPKDWGERN